MGNSRKTKENIGNVFYGFSRLYSRVSRKKRSWKKQSLYMVIVATIVAPSSFYLLNRFSIGIDSQNYPCIPEYRVYLIDKADHDIVKNKTYAFKSQYIEGIGVKVVDGVESDVISVSHEETTINGSMVGEGLALAKESGHSERDLTRNGTIPKGYLWMMGRTKLSFDSRYWGVLPESDIIGRAYPLW